MEKTCLKLIERLSLDEVSPEIFEEEWKTIVQEVAQEEDEVGREAGGEGQMEIRTTRAWIYTEEVVHGRRRSPPSSDA